jgi:hypothetical protein
MSDDRECEDRDFDWRKDANDVVIREQERTAVYTNPHGCVVIRQAGQYSQDEDQLVIVAPEHARKLARAILAAAAGRAAENPATDRTSADRQRRYRKRHRNGVTVTRDPVTDRDGLPLLNGTAHH